LVFHAYINEMYGSRSKIRSKNFRPYIYDVKFLPLLGAPYIYNISRLRVNSMVRVSEMHQALQCMDVYLVTFHTPSLHGTYLFCAWSTTWSHCVPYIYCCHKAVTYLLTPHTTVLKKLTCSQLVNKFPAFYATRSFITAATSARHLCLFWATSIKYMLPTPHPNPLVNNIYVIYFRACAMAFSVCERINCLKPKEHVFHFFIWHS
jgi:hypothetical protein